MTAYALSPTLQLPSVEDVCAEAGVSRATFYKHFDSVQDAADAIGESMLDEMTVSLEKMITLDQPPIERAAIGIQMFLMRSAVDPAWGSFVSRAFQMRKNADVFSGIDRDLRGALQEKGKEIRNFDAMRSLVLGATLEGIRSVHQTGERRRDYVEELTTTILCALGAAPEDATDLVRKTSIYIRGLALDCLEWWQDPWR